MMCQRAFIVLIAAALAGCSNTPAYHPPTLASAAPEHFKADPGWVPAMPDDAAPRGAWWEGFNDPMLDRLEASVAVTNQNVAAARAAWDQARAVVAENRAALFPRVSASAGATRAGNFAQASRGGASATTTLTASANASWDVDLWGKLGASVAVAKANAEASAGDLANATLSAQTALAIDYLTLRALDAEIALADDTLAADARARDVTQHQYAAGTVAHSTLDTTEAALADAETARRDLTRQRAAYEDAVAVLVGENPSTFTLAPAPWAPVVPAVPAVLPSTLAQRRPDVAAAERAVAAANAQIGIQRSAFFPQVVLSGSVGSTASSLSQLFSAATSLWSLGGSVAETLIDFGARSAQLRGARAAYDQAVAAYRQTVLTAFQQVEDELAARKAYDAEDASLSRAADAATRSVVSTRNALAASTVDATSLASAIATANAARQSQITNIANRQAATVSLIGAIGGGWPGAGGAKH